MLLERELSLSGKQKMPQTQLRGVLQHILTLVGTGGGGELDDAQLLRRFVTDRDEAAFATLVRRHGKLVWNICWQVLHHEQDVEDAFQATFLVLAGQASSIRQGNTVPSWLYRVAHRTALGAQKAKVKRRTHETRAALMPRPNSFSDCAWRDLQALLTKEVDRLPEKYRAPFLLCCLGSKSKTEATIELGWKEGTVSSRLARARERLRDRLSRRGVELSSVLGVIALTQHASAAVPLPLLHSTIRAGLEYSAGKIAGSISAEVVALVKGATKAMVMSKVKTMTALLLVAGIAAGGVAALTQREATTQPTASLQAQSPKAKDQRGDQPDLTATVKMRTDQYGDPLPPGALARMGTVRLRHNHPNLLTTAFSSDGKILASGGWNE